MENSSDAKECKHCQIDLQYALEHSEENFQTDSKFRPTNWLMIGLFAGLIPIPFLLALGLPGEALVFFVFQESQVG